MWGMPSGVVMASCQTLATYLETCRSLSPKRSESRSDTPWTSCSVCSRSAVALTRRLSPSTRRHSRDCCSSSRSRQRPWRSISIEKHNRAWDAFGWCRRNVVSFLMIWLYKSKKQIRANYEIILRLILSLNKQREKIRNLANTWARKNWSYWSNLVTFKALPGTFIYSILTLRDSIRLHKFLLPNCTTPQPCHEPLSSYECDLFLALLPGLLIFECFLRSSWLLVPVRKANDNHKNNCK